MFLNKLPEEIIIECLSFLSPSEVAIVCRSWYHSLSNYNYSNAFLAIKTFQLNYHCILQDTIRGASESLNVDDDLYDDCLLQARQMFVLRRKIGKLRCLFEFAKTYVGKIHIIHRVETLTNCKLL